jgi:SAM-dependent methyltransferase
MPAPAPRHVDAVARLELTPTDRVLEIGCGHGVASTLACEAVTDGTFVGIDRSASMVASAQKRNQAHVDAGRARFVRADLAELAPLDLGGGSFDKAFAVNVPAFVDQPGVAFDSIARALAPQGRWVVVYEPPAADRAQAVADRWQADPPGHGLITHTIELVELGAAVAAVLVGSRAG